MAEADDRGMLGIVAFDAIDSVGDDADVAADGDVDALFRR